MRENNKGITLIALVITIIVMLILVGVTISMAVNGGLFDYAGKATGETKNELDKEQQLANGGVEVDGVWYSSINEYLNKDKEKISKTESYIGYYADVDADGTVDGVIYADLAFDGEGELAGESYSYSKAEDLKDYYVSGTYDGDFNEKGEPKEVLTATGEGTDRFYVMALSDIGEHTWYESIGYEGKGTAGSKINTSSAFGTGKANTKTIIEIWNADTDETKNPNDIWGKIQTQVSEGWFVPTKEEWVAFVVGLDACVDWEEIKDTYSVPYGLDETYWTGSIDGIIWEPNDGNENFACPVMISLFDGNFMTYGSELTGNFRLSTTF